MLAVRRVTKEGEMPGAVAWNLCPKELPAQRPEW
jgi:hypothetical protein